MTITSYVKTEQISLSFGICISSLLIIHSIKFDCLPYLIFFFLPHSMWDLSSPMRDQTCTYPLQWKLSVLTNEPPGKSHVYPISKVCGIYTSASVLATVVLTTDNQEVYANKT